MQMDVAIAVTFLVCISYTAIGGIKAVIWTNVFQVLLEKNRMLTLLIWYFLFQAFCMLLSAVVVVIVGESAVGGSGEVFKANYESGRIEIFNLDPSPLTR